MYAGSLRAMRLWALSLVFLYLYFYHRQHLRVMPPPGLRYPFICVDDCARSFRSQRGLSLHQTVCILSRETRDRELHELALAAEAQDLYNNAPPSTRDIVSYECIKLRNHQTNYVIMFNLD